MTPLLGFAPDLDPTTPGVITECANFVPYESGMKAANTPIDVGQAALASACRGSALTRDLSNTSRLFAGTSSNIYEAAGMTWNSAASGFALSADDVWRFAVLGNSPLAVCPSANLQIYSAGVFSAITGAPKAKVVVVAKGFVMLLATNDPVYGDSPDRWYCSASFDPTDWTPNVATQCGTGRLVEGAGPLTAGLRMGDTIVAYKERCVFVGQYVGGAAIWQWSPPIGDVGCVGVEAVADTPIGHVFVGSDNFYLFDGTRPVPIGDQVKQWWLDNSSSQYRYRTKLLWDRENNSVMVFYPSVASTGNCDSVLVYHILRRQWGVMTKTVEAVINYASQGITYDGGLPLITTYDTGPALSFDSPFWLTSKSSPGYFGTDHKIYTLTGVPGVSSFVTGDIGDESYFSWCDAVRVRCALQPTSMSIQGYTKAMSGADVLAGSGSSFDGSKFPMRQLGRFHRFAVTLNGAGKFTAYAASLKPAGNR